MKTLEELEELKETFETCYPLQSAQVAYALNIDMKAVKTLENWIKTQLCMCQVDAWISKLEDEQADEK